MKAPLHAHVLIFIPFLFTAPSLTLAQNPPLDRRVPDNGGSPTEIAPGLVPYRDFTQLIERAREQDPPEEPFDLSQLAPFAASAEVRAKPGGRYEIVLANGASFEPSWSRSPLGTFETRRLLSDSEQTGRDRFAKLLELIIPSAFALPPPNSCPTNPAVPPPEACYPASNNNEIVSISGQVTSYIDANGIEQLLNPPIDTTGGYDYVPSIIQDDGIYKVWWCAHNLAWGDRINYTEFEINQQTGQVVRTGPILEVFSGPGTIKEPQDDRGDPGNCNLESQFDCALTCDPSVVKFPGLYAGNVVDIYFMAYSGFKVGNDKPSGTVRTNVGLALSLDGKRWSRIDRNPSTSVIDPILMPAVDIQIPLQDDVDYDGDGLFFNPHGDTINYLLYGAGHPSLTLKGDKFYITLLDDSNPETLQALNDAVAGVVPDLQNPGGPPLPPLTSMSQIDDAQDDYYLNVYPLQKQYALRSIDIAFQIGTEEWRNQPNPWVSIPSGIAATRVDSYFPYVTIGGNTFQIESTSVDWAYSPQTTTFIMSINGLKEILPPGTPGVPREYNSFRFFDEDLDPIDTLTTHVESSWEEGPGLFKRANGQAILTHNCANYKLDTLRSIYWNPQNKIGARNEFWELALFSEELETGLSACSAVSFDYDGDGTGDEAIYRPSDADYWINHTSEGPENHGLGQQGDKPVLGDFDGDGTIDKAVIRPSGTIPDLIDWHWISSIDNQLRIAYTWGFMDGQTDDQIAVADYNGDGLDDFTVYRSGTKEFHILYSTGIGSPPILTHTEVWLNSNSIAVTEDFDGDGTDDYAVYRPSTGKWSVKRSSLGNVHFTFGGVNCRPVPGDYDNDGLADYGCRNPFNGTWTIRRSSTGVNEAKQWGLPGDIPVIGDFTGDGVLDFTVYRPSEGKWYVWDRAKNQQGPTTQWGLPPAPPVPSDLVPKRIENQS